MEQRKITVVSTRDHIRKTFMSSAKTLGELKSEMTTNGINHDGLTYLEGLTKAEYKDDSSLLPATVTYEDPTTGEEKTTTELVFILSQPNKKIKSGAYTRAKAYDCIKQLHLEDEVKKVYGKNYTQVSTDALGKLIDECVAEGLAATPPERVICHKKVATEPETPAGDASNPGAIESLQAQIVNLKNQIDNIKEAIRILTELSSDTDSDDEENIENLLNEDSSMKSVEAQVMDDSLKSDLPEGMFDDMVNRDWME